MNNYSKEDLERRPWNKSPPVYWNIYPLHALKRIVRSWLESPLLRPQNTTTTWVDYEHLNTSRIKKRITEEDWPDGLYMVQYSELEVEAFLLQKRKRKWKTLKLIATGEKEMVLSMSAVTVRDGLQKYISSFCKCHVYGFTPLDSNTMWYRILPFDKGSAQTPSRRPTLLIHYKNTEYFLLACPSSGQNVFVEQAILSVFGASAIKKQFLTSNSLDALNKILTHRSSLGIFGQFRYMQRDPVHNPLNFGRLSTPAIRDNTDRDSPNPGDTDSSKDEDQQSTISTNKDAQETIYHYPKFTFVQTGEQQRRIIPIQQEKMDQRYDNVEQVFGNYPLEGLESLNIKLSLSVEPVLADHGIQIATEPSTDDEDPVNNFLHHDKLKKKQQGPIDEFFNSGNDDGMVDDDVIDESDKGSINEDNEEDEDDEDEDEDPFDTMDHKGKTFLTMNIRCKGQNVMAGLRDLALHGYMDPPYPSWMTELVASGSTQVYITEDKMYLDFESLPQK